MIKKITAKAKALLQTYCREIFIFVFLFFSLLCTIPASLHDWNCSWYAMDYSLGFDSRLLIGSLLKLIYPEFLTAAAAYHFVFFSLILLLLLLSFILGYALRQTKDSSAGTGLLGLILLYLLCPGSPAYLWTEENMGRFDLYLLILLLAAVVIYFKVSSALLRLALFTVCGLAAISVHQVFMFIFFPLLFTMLVSTIAEMENKKTGFIAGFLGILCLCGTFFYFQFFSHLNISSSQELAALLASRTSLPVSELPLRHEYFMPLADSIRELVLNQAGERIRYGAVTLFLLLPLLLIYGRIWYSIKTDASKKTRYFLMFFGQFSCLPAFFLTLDWGRWFGAFLTVQALQIVILAAKKDAAVLNALSKLNDDYRKHPYLFIASALFLASLHKFQATLLPDAPVFFTSLYRLYRLLF